MVVGARYYFENFGIAAYIQKHARKVSNSVTTEKVVDVLAKIDKLL